VNSVSQSEDLLFSILLQLIVMILAARFLNTVARRLGQPGVVGEIIAGLLLGPSLFGHFFPHLSGVLFGAVPSTINVISQLGLVFLMFQIGMDFEFSLLQQSRNRRGALVVAVASIFAPFLLGLAIGYSAAPSLAPHSDPLVFSLFCGVSLAITAMPVLGRVMRQYGLTHTEIGVVAISAAAVNDVVGWLLLAGLTAYTTARFSGAHMAWQIVGLVSFLLVMRYAMRPLIALLMEHRAPKDGAMSSNLMALCICLMFAAGICTYKLGIFAIFGGFACGMLFHSYPEFVRAWRAQVGQFVTVFLLPVFFTYTGLRTDITGLTTPESFAWLGVILAAGILGKILPVYFAARSAGFDRTRSWLLGSLMNTRGLMELIVLNIGFDLGVLPQPVFTMLVIMAVVTNIMVGPLLRTLLPRIGHAVPKGIEA
jgi:Kef-type K+ transport system membrane component KefB